MVGLLGLGGGCEEPDSGSAGPPQREAVEEDAPEGASGVDASADGTGEETSVEREGTSRYRFVVDLEQLEERGALEGMERVEVTVDDPAYDGTKTFQGWRLSQLLETHAELSSTSTEQMVVQFVATDGYRVSARLSKLPLDSGVIADRVEGAPPDERWLPFRHGDDQTTPAPFYLVWREPGEHGDELPWAYKLVKLGFAERTALWGEAVPGHDETLRPGFEVFRTQCMKCHSVNLAGGSVGPELNVPVNVTEYWKSGHLRKYIRNPKSYRADASMPSVGRDLSEAEMEDLLTYLRGMRRAKVCTSAEACGERLRRRD